MWGNVSGGCAGQARAAHRHRAEHRDPWRLEMRPGKRASLARHLSLQCQFPCSTCRSLLQ